MLADFAAIAGGLALLVIGAELFVRGSVQIAERMGLSPLLIGLTLVGFGTSTPELLASIQAALAGSPGIAAGNAVGSNIFNVLGILAIAAIVAPVAVARQALWRDGSVVIAGSVLLVAVSFVSDITRLIGAVFVALLAGYLYYCYRQDRSCAPDEHTAAFGKAQALEEVVTHSGGGAAAVQTTEAASLFVSLTTAVGGLCLIVFGADYLVSGAISLARDLGVSEAVIGLTIVAIGTSLPELVTSVVAALKRHSDIALGNVLGSNIYNIFGILGLTALVSPIPVPPEIIWRDNLVMLAVAVLLFIVARTGYVVGRREGVGLLLAYVAYVAVIWPR